MTRPRPENYYEARGFSVYYLANTVFNIVSTPGAYMRGIEEILGDMRGADADATLSQVYKPARVHPGDLD